MESDTQVNRHFPVVGGQLLFGAASKDEGEEVWASDGANDTLGVVGL